MADYKLNSFGVIRERDGALVPPDMGNVDWQAYQQWLIAGNTPDPMDDPNNLPDEVQDEIAISNEMMNILRSQAIANLQAQGTLKSAMYAGTPAATQNPPPVAT